MFNILKPSIFAVAILSFFSLSSCENQQSSDDFSITLRLSHVFNVNEELAQSIELVAERINKKTNGAVRVLTYPGGQIATYKDGVEMVVRGAHFISVEDPSYIGDCLLYTSPSPRDLSTPRMPSSA